MEAVADLLGGGEGVDGLSKLPEKVGGNSPGENRNAVSCDLLGVSDCGVGDRLGDAEAERLFLGDTEDVGDLIGE